MAMAVFTSDALTDSRVGHILDTALAILRAYRRRAADRHALATAGRLDARLRADIGLEEVDAHALAGGWENLTPNRFLVRPIAGGACGKA